jgi:hypothetical protein
VSADDRSYLLVGFIAASGAISAVLMMLAGRTIGLL